MIFDRCIYDFYMTHTHIFFYDFYMNPSRRLHNSFRLAGGEARTVHAVGEQLIGPSVRGLDVMRQLFGQEVHMRALLQLLFRGLTSHRFEIDRGYDEIRYIYISCLSLKSA